MGLGISIPNPVKAVKRIGSGVKKAAGAAKDWAGDNWKTIAALAASTLVFAAIVGLAVLLPFAVPVLLTLLVAGFASGAAFYAVDQWLNGRPIDPKQVLIQGAISAALTVATAGLGRVAAPALARVLPGTASAIAPGLLRQTVSNTAVGAVFGGGAKVAENAIAGHPLTDGLGDATALGAINGALVAPATKLTTPGATHPQPARRTETPVDPEIAQRGVGARSYHDYKPGFGGVEPLSPIAGADRLNMDAWNAHTDTFRRSGPLVLTEEQLARLEPGRIGPSGTLRAGDTTAISNFEAAAKKVNGFVASGEDLSVERIAELNRILLSKTDKSAYAGVIRSNEDVFHYMEGGRMYFYAAPADVPLYLDDFMGWYRVNERVLPPAELAGAAYQQLVRIHPFTDSNGRATRLVMDWILQRNGLPPAIYTTADSEAVHATTAYVVANTAKATSTSHGILTKTSDTSAVPETKGFIGTLGGH